MYDLYQNSINFVCFTGYKITMASQITGVFMICSTVGSDTDQRKHQSSASLAFVWGIHRWPVNSAHKRPITRKMYPFNDVIMTLILQCLHRGFSSVTHCTDTDGDGGHIWASGLKMSCFTLAQQCLTIDDKLPTVSRGSKLEAYMTSGQGTRIVGKISTQSLVIFRKISSAILNDVIWWQKVK